MPSEELLRDLGYQELPVSEFSLCASLLTYITPTEMPPQQVHEIVPLLQTRKYRLREVEQLVWVYKHGAEAE